MTGQGRKTAPLDRILVVDPNMATAKLLAGLLRSLWPTVQVHGAQDSETAMVLAQVLEPELVFVEAAGSGFDGLAFARTFRRSDFDFHETPLIMVLAEAKAAQVLAAREAGAHEFLRRPISMGELERRLEAVSGPPRDFVEAPHYIGPDPRRFNSARGGLDI
ncbi:MAG TPA: response regulator [Caulobacteraceae bacterium]